MEQLEEELARRKEILGTLVDMIAKRVIELQKRQMVTPDTEIQFTLTFNEVQKLLALAKPKKPRPKARAHSVQQRIIKSDFILKSWANGTRIMSQITVMQLSDLHKKASTFLSSKALVSSLASDIARYRNEEIPISKPDILVVCGDIIRGSEPSVDFEKSIREIGEQYSEANDILSQLCIEFFNGDKQRIVMVPGNHDVSWPHSGKSMEKLESFDPNLAELCKRPRSDVRWSWEDLSFYKISDYYFYRQRFLPFSEFYTTFYNNQRKYSLIPEEQYDIFEFPKYGLLFVGFNSCFRNDHLNHVGMIHPECMARCHSLISQEKYEDWLKIAVWHHDVRGFPTRLDFMDERTVQFLIDKGFHIGLHGHRHTNDIFEVKFSADQSLEIKIFGCGTLSAPRQNIPLGETRQYSVIEIDHSFTRLRYHVRKAVPQPPELPIWMRGDIRQNKDNSYIDVVLNKDKGKEQRMPPTSVFLKELAEAEDLVAKKEYSQALKKLEILDQGNPFVRRLTIECLWQLDMNDELIKFIKEPNTVTEFAYLSEALWNDGKISELTKLLDKSSKNAAFANSEPFKRMREKLKDRGN